MRGIAQFEKIVSEGLAGLSGLLLASIAGLFVMEIFMRYALGSPTKWSNDTVTFIMPAMIFLALPEVTRRCQHIAITFLMESLGSRAAIIWSRVLALMSSVVCFAVFTIIGTTVIKQFGAGILTNTVVQIPKWILLAPITVSFFVMAVIFLATAFGLERDNGFG